MTNRQLTRIALAIALLTGPARADGTVGEKETLRYLREVLLEKEFGEGSGQVLRWKESPEVVLVEDPAEAAELLAGVVRQLNDALEKAPVRLKLVDTARTDRRIDVFLVPEKRFAEIGRERDFTVPDNVDGFVHVRWNTERKFITRATVLVAIDKVDGAMRQHTLLEEMTQALGPVGDTTVSPDSVVYSRDGDHGKAPTLGQLDRRMLRLLYEHLEPGDGGIEVGVAYARHWRD